MYWSGTVMIGGRTDVIVSFASRAFAIVSAVSKALRDADEKSVAYRIRCMPFMNGSPWYRRRAHRHRRDCKATRTVSVEVSDGHGAGGACWNSDRSRARRTRAGAM